MSNELITAVSTVDGVDPTELEKLASTIDPDALDALFRPRADDVRSDGDIRLRFRYAGHLVDIRSDGTMTFYSDFDGD